MKLVKTVGILCTSLGLAALLLWTSGCSSEQPAAPAPEQGSAAGDHGDHVHADGEHADHDHDAETAGAAAEQDDATKIEAALASLSADDRALATKQKICPVSGEALGLMGTPEKVDVEGQFVFICCAGCKDMLLEDPNSYLAKLGLKPAAE
jgi:hypothetical protein